MINTPPFPTRPVDHKAFHIIDTHQKAYLLGMLLTDGTIKEARPGFSSPVTVLRIKAEDIKVCRMLYDLVGGSLYFIENGYRVAWQVSSEQIAHDLIALGVTPRKTFTASLRWHAISADFHGAVLAGLIDGDGHLRFSRAQRRAEISLVTASTTLRDQLLDRFPFLKLRVAPSGEKRKNAHFTLLVESNRELLTALIRTVYAALPFAILDRKQSMLDAIRGYLKEQDDYDQAMLEVPRLKASGLTIKQIAVALGTSVRPIRARLEALNIVSARVVFTEDDRQEMRRLHGLGYTVLQIHAAIGKGTEQAVRFHLQRLGCLQKTPKPLVRHPLSDQILKLHHDGVAAYKIAERLEMGEPQVCRILHKARVHLQSGSPKKLTPDLLDHAKQELQKGRTLQSVSDEIGVSTTLLRLRLREKVTRQDRGDAQPLPDE